MKNFKIILVSLSLTFFSNCSFAMNKNPENNLEQQIAKEQEKEEIINNLSFKNFRKKLEKNHFLKDGCVTLLGIEDEIISLTFDEFKDLIKNKFKNTNNSTIVINKILKNEMWHVLPYKYDLQLKISPNKKNIVICDLINLESDILNNELSEKDKITDEDSMDSLDI